MYDLWLEGEELFRVDWEAAPSRPEWDRLRRWSERVEKRVRAAAPEHLVVLSGHLAIAEVKMRIALTRGLLEQLMQRL